MLGDPADRHGPITSLPLVLLILILVLLALADVVDTEVAKVLRSLTGGLLVTK